MTLRLNGDSSGFTEIKAPNAAGDNSITLPTSNGGANQLLQNGGTAGELQYTSAGGGLHYDSSGRLLLGHSTSINSPIDAPFALLGADFDDSSLKQYRIGSSSFGPSLLLMAANGTAAAPTAGTAGQEIGKIRFYGHDGTDFNIPGAAIRANFAADAVSDNLPGSLTFSTNGGGSSTTDRVRIASTGELQLLAGCPGIDFSETQNNVAGMTGETLGSYEEGQFTPTLTFGGNNTGMVFHNNTGGSYTRIGRWVYVHIRIELTNKGTSTGNAVIPNLPFNAGDIQSGSSAVEASQALGGYQLNAFITTNGNHTSLSGRLHADTNDLILEFNNYATGTTSQLGNGSFANNSSFSFDFMYQTND